MIAKKEIRTIFLREFTRHLILNSKKETTILIDLQPSIHNSKQTIVSQILPAAKIEQNQATRKAIQNLAQKYRNFFEKPKPIARPAVIPIKTAVPQNFQKSITSQESENPNISSINPNPEPIPQGFSLGKLDQFIPDKNVLGLECPGPGKLILIKGTLGRVFPAKISLTEDEIRKIIFTFSRYSKIPVAEGIFKAAVGNLIITAIISESVGSRFIINKYTPYSILENNYR